MDDKIKEDLLSIDATLSDIRRFTLRAAFDGGFSTDRAQDIYLALQYINKTVAKLEKLR